MSKMNFPSAGDYYKSNDPLVIDPSIDTTAELPIFHFGLQPTGLKDIDVRENRKIGIIGCGSAYKIFSGPALKQRGTKIYIIDTADTSLIEKRLGRKLDPEREIKIGSVDELPRDVDYVAILTPPEHHAAEIRKFQNRGTPTMVEKPLVCMGAHLTGNGSIEERLKEKGGAPVYAMDWEVLLATPLMAALDMKPTFESIVEFGHDGADKTTFKQFDLNNVVNIETTFVEGGDNELGKKQPDRGGWLWDITKGGGGLYDMGVHALNTIAILGLIPEKDKIDDVALGEPNFEGTQGIYKAIGSNSTDIDPRTGSHRPVAEMYARAHLTSRYHGRSIPTMVECGKGGHENDMRITMTDKDGRILDWEYGPDKSLVSLKNVEGEILATAQSHIDPYALMFEEATRFFEREKQAKAKDPNHKPTALYYAEHKAVLEALDAIQAKGRASPVQETDEVKQLKHKHAAHEAPPSPFHVRVPQPRRDPVEPDGTAFGIAGTN